MSAGAVGADVDLRRTGRVVVPVLAVVVVRLTAAVAQVGRDRLRSPSGVLGATGLAVRLTVPGTAPPVRTAGDAQRIAGFHVTAGEAHRRGLRYGLAVEEHVVDAVGK